MPVAGIARPNTGGVVTLVAEVMGHLALQGPFEHGLGHLIEQTVDAVDRGAGRVRISKQRINRLGLQRRREPAGGRGVGRRYLKIFVVHWDVLPDHHAAHGSRSWSVRCLHSWHDTPLVNDAIAVLAGIEELHPDGEDLTDQQSQAVALLALIAGQDVEPAPGSDGTDGRWRIAE